MAATPREHALEQQRDFGFRSFFWHANDVQERKQPRIEPSSTADGSSQRAAPTGAGRSLYQCLEKSTPTDSEPGEYRRVVAEEPPFAHDRSKHRE
jgi:hypothetical protein